MMLVDDVIARVRKLLALSESANEAEAGLAAEAAARLIVRHQLTDEQVRRDHEVADGIVSRKVQLRCPMRHRWDCYKALAIIGSVFSVEVFFTGSAIDGTFSGPGKIESAVRLIGHVTDITAVAALWESLAPVVMLGAKKSWLAHKKCRLEEFLAALPPSANLPEYLADQMLTSDRGMTAWIRGYILGFADRVRRRLAQARAEVSATEQDGVVALLDRGARVKHWIDAKMDVQIIDVPERGFDESAVTAGNLDGARVPLGGKELGR